MKKTIGVFWLCALFFTAKAATVDTIETYSAAMSRKIKAVVIAPDNYKKNGQYPVVYLLHGYAADYAAWPKASALAVCSDVYQMLIVCADGGYGSWYWDSPQDPAYKYETYISRELVQWIDDKYATIKNSKGRAIAGLSMGGHGALYLAIKHPDVFGAAGSMSGGVDIRPFTKSWGMEGLLGPYTQYPARWDRYTVMGMLHLIEPGRLRIIIDCGTEDFFYNVNEALHREMLLRNIKHDYITRPGTHNWDYWKNAVQYQLLFMHNYFTEK